MNVCRNGHAMDEGLFNCPACGVYRPSPHAPKVKVRARCCGIMYEHGGLVSPVLGPCHDCPNLR